MLDLQGKCQVKKRKVPAIVSEAVALVQELLQSGTGANTVPSSDFSFTTDEYAATLAAEIDKSKSHIPELETTEIITVCRIEEILKEVKNVTPKRSELGKRPVPKIRIAILSM